MGDYTITKDPTRDKGLRILMGPFSIYDKTTSRRRPSRRGAKAFSCRKLQMGGGNTPPIWVKSGRNLARFRPSK